MNSVQGRAQTQEPGTAESRVSPGSMLYGAWGYGELQGLQQRFETEKAEIQAAIEDESLGFERFDGLKERMEQLPESMKTELQSLYHEYRAMAVDYRNQLDNDYRAKSSCNVTALAMTLQDQGIPIPGLQPGQQPEDRLAELLRDEFGMTLDGEDHPAHWPWVRERLVRELLQGELRTEPANGLGASGCRDFFMLQVLPLLKLGASACLGIRWTRANGSTGGHIVRLQWVDDTGITVDDPYGDATFNADASVNWKGAGVNSSDVADADAQAGRAGDNSHWSYDDCHRVLRYVQWTSTPGTAASTALAERLDTVE